MIQRNVIDWLEESALKHADKTAFEPEGGGIGIGNQTVGDLSGESVMDESLTRQFEEYRN